MKKILFFIAALSVICSATTDTYAQGANCASAQPACFDVGPIFFPAAVGTTAEPGYSSGCASNCTGNNYGCLLSQPSPGWFYIEVANSGTLDLQMSAPSDIDFATWGPYSDLSSATANCGTLPAPAGCSYSTSGTENTTISGTAGQVFLVMITNFANTSQNISFVQTGGTGSTDCTIVNPVCDISNIAVTGVSACNDNGTPAITTDDYFTATITVTFTDPPTGGTLTLSGDALSGGGALSQPAGASPMVFSGIRFAADGLPKSVIASFDLSCTMSQAVGSVPSCSTPPPCNANNGAWN